MALQQETFGPSRLPRSSDRSPGHLRIKRGYPVIFVHEFAGVGRRLRLRRRARPGRAVPRRGRGLRRTPGERGHGGQGRSHIRSITTPISSPTSALGSRVVSAPASSAWSRRRTFITRAARKIFEAGGSLRDVHCGRSSRSVRGRCRGGGTTRRPAKCGRDRPSSVAAWACVIWAAR